MTADLSIKEVAEFILSLCNDDLLLLRDEIEDQLNMEVKISLTKPGKLAIPYPHLIRGKRSMNGEVFYCQGVGREWLKERSHLSDEDITQILADVTNRNYTEVKMYLRDGEGVQEFIQDAIRNRVFFAIPISYFEKW